MKPLNFDGKGVGNGQILSKVIRSALLYHGREVPIMPGSEGPWHSYDYDSIGANPNGSKFVQVLKEESGVPICWSEGGINWCWYGAASKEEAENLYRTITGVDAGEGEIIIDRSDSYWQFRIHN